MTVPLSEREIVEPRADTIFREMNKKLKIGLDKNVRAGTAIAPSNYGAITE
jgi:hypothetical protein